VADGSYIRTFHEVEQVLLLGVFSLSRIGCNAFDEEVTASSVTRKFPFDYYVILVNSVTTQFWMTGQMILTLFN
jgi:hypothetical protein